MKRTLESEQSFVVDLLATLRNEKFSPLAWYRFLVRSWTMACRTADAQPSLKRSWARVTLFIVGLAITILLLDFSVEGLYSGLRLLPGFLFCVLWQQSDLFWHLGLNRQAQTGELLPGVGSANTFTWLRGLAASYLLGRLIGGLITPNELALLIFLAGIATDILDGQIARRSNTQSKLGQIGDGEADFCLSLAITLILMQNAVLPLWLGIVIFVRFFVPLLAALGSYFLFAQPLRFGSTSWGKYAGLAQCLYFLLLLTPPQFTFLTQPLNLPLLIATLILLIAAPIAQIVKHIRAVQTEKG